MVLNDLLRYQSVNLAILERLKGILDYFWRDKNGYIIGNFLSGYISIYTWSIYWIVYR